MSSLFDSARKVCATADSRGGAQWMHLFTHPCGLFPLSRRLARWMAISMTCMLSRTKQLGARHLQDKVARYLAPRARLLHHQHLSRGPAPLLVRWRRLCTPSPSTVTARAKRCGHTMSKEASVLH